MEVKVRTKNKLIVRYKKPLNINIGMIILTLVFLYLGINCIIYLSRDKISIYEVTKGQSEEIAGIATTGIALRTENVTNAPASGYINYYIKEGTKVSVGNTLYTIDENGDFSERLENAAENDSMLTNENLSEIKTDISKFVSSYDSKKFDEVYDFKYNLDATLLENINLNNLSTINESITANGGAALSLNKADRSGIVEFYIDGYEGLTNDKITDDLFDEKAYNKNPIKSGSSVESGKPIYKTIDNEEWEIVIPLTKKQAEDYKDTTVVDISFPSEGIKTSAYFSIIDNNGSKYGIIGLRRYMIQFVGDRFINIKIDSDKKEGLKVPKTAIVKKDYYEIPIDYITNGGDTSDEGFMKEEIVNNETKSVFVAASIVSRNDTICYVETSDKLQKGDVIAKPNSTDRYQIDKTEKLAGVYNVNTGYTTFRYVKILSEKNGYYIVESGSKYGLQVYDQIVLNASLVKENQVIFK